MPKRKKKSGLPAAVFLLGLIALVLFAAGQAWVLFHSDTGQLRLARWMPGNRREHVGQILSAQIRRGLTASEVPPDSVHENAASGTRPAAWRVGLRPDQSLLQTNYAITHYVELKGGSVLSAREIVPERGVMQVRMVIGLPRLATQEVLITRGARGEDRPAPGSARLAIVLFGLADDPKEAKLFLDLPAPFAVALQAGGPKSGALFRAAHAASRELVVALPLEPVNYPRVNPGPGTLLVTMSPAEITGLTRKYLDQAGALVAVTNHMGSLATQDMTAMKAVFEELQRRHAPFVHLMPASGAVCKSLAGDAGVVYSEPGAVLDAEARATKPRILETRWAEILERARDRGRMTVWIRATPQVRSWLPRAVTPKVLGGVDVVPLSALLKKGANP